VVAASELKTVVDGLSDLGNITSRPMFGGHGIYWREVIFGMVFRERLYFKVDDQAKGEYVSRGMGPFRPNERQTLKSYYEVPSEILEDREALLSWAREAIRAGLESQDRQAEPRSRGPSPAITRPIDRPAHHRFHDLELHRRLIPRLAVVVDRDLLAAMSRIAVNTLIRPARPS
jgi:DNA transformation protein and related proteins